MITIENYNYELKMHSNVDGIQSYLIREAAKTINPCSVIKLCNQIEKTVEFIEDNDLTPWTRYFGIRQQCVTQMHKGDICTDEEFQQYENVMYQIIITNKNDIKLNEMTVKPVEKDRRYDIVEIDITADVYKRVKVIVPHDYNGDPYDYIIDNYQDDLVDIMQEEFDNCDWCNCVKNVEEDLTAEQINHKIFREEPINFNDFEDELECEFDDYYGEDC